MANVLVVDDDSSVHILLSALLVKAGYAVVAVESVDEALLRLAAWPADVVVCDLSLPRRDGLDLLREVRARWPRVQVIMMTGGPTFDSTGVAIRNRASDYLIKPFSKERLLDSVGLAAAAKFKEDELVRLEDENRRFREGLERLVDERTTALRASEARYRTILRTAMDGFWQVDMQGRLLDVNEAYCRMSGYREHELLGMCIPDLEAAESHDFSLARIQKIMAQGMDRFETRHRRKDGSSVAVEVSVQYKSAEGGHMVAFLRDLTERKRVAQELQERMRQIYHMERVQTMGEIASSLAHEVNQPLAGIMSNAQAAQRFLEGTPPDLDQIREILADIVADGKRAGDVVGHMRAMLRSDTPSADALDINSVVREAVALLQASLRLHEVTVRVEAAEGLPRVCAAKTQVEQVILNLIMNAEQAMQNTAAQERVILVSTGRDPSGQVTISVRDCGPGFSTEALTRLFEAFYTTKANGLGMGLSISRSIVTAHGGRIWVENNVDCGAKVSFALPAAEGGGA